LALSSRPAQVLGLAHMVMANRLPVRLRALVPAVDNAISGESFRPGDILVARNGLTRPAAAEISHH
jgi:leucyl aminopeptidase